MVSHVRHRRLHDPTAIFPVVMEPGELAVNTSSLQLAAGDADPANPGIPNALLPIRYFSERGWYDIGEMVVYAGTIYRARVVVDPAVFDPAQWMALVGNEPGQTLGNKPLFAYHEEGTHHTLILQHTVDTPVEANTIEWRDLSSDGISTGITGRIWTTGLVGDAMRIQSSGAILLAPSFVDYAAANDPHYTFVLDDGGLHLGKSLWVAGGLSVDADFALHGQLIVHDIITNDTGSLSIQGKFDLVLMADVGSVYLKAPHGSININTDGVGNTYIGGNIILTGPVEVTGPGFTVDPPATFRMPVQITDTTAAGSGFSGCLALAGGLGVTGMVWCGNNILATNRGDNVTMRLRHSVSDTSVANMLRWENSHGEICGGIWPTGASTNGTMWLSSRGTIAFAPLQDFALLGSGLVALIDSTGLHLVGSAGLAVGGGVIVTGGITLGGTLTVHNAIINDTGPLTIEPQTDLALIAGGGNVFLRAFSGVYIADDDDNNVFIGSGGGTITLGRANHTGGDCWIENPTTHVMNLDIRGLATFYDLTVSHDLTVGNVAHINGRMLFADMQGVSFTPENGAMWYANGELYVRVPFGLTSITKKITTELA